MQAKNVTSTQRQAISPANPNIALYAGGDPTSTTANELFTAIGAGSYTTLVLWAAHIDADGNIRMNDDPVVTNGQFQASAIPWANLVNGMREGSVTRIELSIGGDSTSFANIKTLICQYGTCPNNPLYASLQAFNSAVPLDAVNYDDESEYDQESSVSLASICSALGMHVSICPYTMQSYWVELITAINKNAAGSADAVYLQCYDGGASNDPADWNKAFAPTGLAITPGLWATHPEGDPQVCTTFTTSSQAQSQMQSWAEASTLAGGWMYNGTDMMTCTKEGGTPAAYATAILAGLNAANSPLRKA